MALESMSHVSWFENSG